VNEERGILGILANWVTIENVLKLSLINVQVQVSNLLSDTNNLLPKLAIRRYISLSPLIPRAWRPLLFSPRTDWQFLGY
jgi:hypothetical protein